MFRQIISVILAVTALVLITINNDDKPPACIAIAGSLKLAGCN